MIIEEISINSKKYPEQLRNIYKPPLKLYALGNKELLYQKGIAIVGARKATQYGKNTAYKISSELSKQGINIISGLAIGIDTCAHIGAIQNVNNEKVLLNNSNIGRTIAVLGSGIDKIYPKDNIELARNIIKSGGCIISEYPIGTKPEKIHFPQRNRIISALSIGVLVVEASKKSGALITAEFALEQGREVFAIPGNIDRIESEGCNELIRDGANMVTSYKDIIEYINI